MRGQLKQAIVVAGLFQLAETVSDWSWSPGNGPLAGTDPFIGLVLISAMYRLAGAAALGFILNSLRKNFRNISPHTYPGEPRRAISSVPPC